MGPIGSVALVRLWPIASSSCAEVFGRYWCTANSAKLSARQIYGFTA